MERRGKDKLII